MAYWKIGLLALKVRRGWARIPPEQRKRMIKQARKHGPTVAKRVGTAVKQVRKRR